MAVLSRFTFCFSVTLYLPKGSRSLTGPPGGLVRPWQAGPHCHLVPDGDQEELA